jgi:hypothetical protein
MQLWEIQVPRRRKAFGQLPKEGRLRHARKEMVVTDLLSDFVASVIDRDLSLYLVGERIEEVYVMLLWLYLGLLWWWRSC